MTEELIFRYGLLLLFITFLGIRGYFGHKARPVGQKRTRKQRWADQIKYESKIMVILRIFVVYAMIIFVLAWSLLPFLIPFWTQFIVHVWIRWLGIIIDVVMVVAIIWVGISLKKQVSGSLEIKTGHQLVTKGPYKYVRHPMYLVYLLFNIGMLLICGNIILILLIILGILLIIPRMQIEEQMMIKQFGNEYRKYMEQTGRLIPRLRRKKSR